MNKNRLVLALVSALASSVAVAGNAVLNVEGEIQINGETVINSNGDFVGGNSIPSVKSIVLDDYQQSNGIYKYSITELEYDYESGNYVESICLITETISNSRFDAVEECGDNTYTYSWVTNNDGTHTATYDFGADNTGTTVYSIEQLTDEVSEVSYGSTLVEIVNESIISTTDEWLNAGDFYTYLNNVGYFGDLSDLDIGNGIVVEDCVITEFSDAYDFRVKCKGLGTINIFNTYDHIIEYIELPAQNSALSVQAQSANQNLLLDGYKRKIEQLKKKKNI